MLKRPSIYKYHFCDKCFFFQFEKEYERAYPGTSLHLIQKWGAVFEDIIQYTTQMMPNWMDELDLGDSDGIELEKLREGRVLICCPCPTLKLITTFAPVINVNVKRNPNPNPKPNLKPYPTLNQKPNHYPHSNSLLSEISSPEQMSPELLLLVYLRTRHS